MKKIFGTVFAFFLILTMSGCSAEKQEATEKKAGEINKESSSSSNSNPIANNSQAKSSREDCISGCNVMWKTNKSNEGNPESKMASDCSSLCDAGQGIQNQDVDSCAKAEGMLRDTCYSDIARNTNNPKLCEKVTEKLFISACYSGIAEKTKDAALCDKIPDKMMKEACLDGIK